MTEERQKELIFVLKLVVIALAVIAFNTLWLLIRVWGFHP